MGPFYYAKKIRPKCDICDGTSEVRQFRKWLLGVDMKMCRYCSEVWYDGGETEVARIRLKSLLAQNPKTP